MIDLLQRWFAAGPQLTAQQAARLAAWQALPEVVLDSPFAQARYVVVDVETTGLNMRSDTLISIGAVAVVNGRIRLGDSFAVVLQQDKSSQSDNILIHGIGGSEQLAGENPAEALLAFLEFLGKAPLFAFHVAFDANMIQRALRQYLGFGFTHPWLDLAYVLPALHPGLRYSHRSLDDWAGYFKLQHEDRHNAVSDALVTAQLLLLAMQQARSSREPSYEALRFFESNFRNAG